MASSGKYDEDVYENPFFTGIISKYPEYVDKTAACKGILCVPKHSIAAQSNLTPEEIEDHILLPTTEVVDDTDDFVTISKKTVQLSEGKIRLRDEKNAQIEVAVLFAETFHTDNGSSYRVFCIGGFLNKVVDTSPTDPNIKKNVSPSNYEQCMDLLWSHSGGQKTREGLDKILATYASTYDRLEGQNLRSIVDAANTHFTKAMQLLLKDSVVRRSVRYNPHYMDNLKVAVETYVMSAVHRQLFRVITATVAGQDAEINKLTRNLVELQLSDLGIRKIFSENIPPAKKELSQLNRYSTPMGRLLCIKRVVYLLTKPPRSKKKEKSQESTSMMTTDDLLPILIFLIIKSETPNWMANLIYMRHFHFAKSSDDDEFGFYLASVEAALEHIRSGNIKDEIKPLKRERWNSMLNMDGVDGFPSSSTLLQSSVPTPNRQNSHASTIDEFFRLVQEGDEKSVREMLQKPHKSSEEIYLKMCHPLCSCDKCDKLVASLRNNSNLVTAYTRDNRGYTALHIASYYGQGLLIDLLIQNNAVVDATDYLGLTPLHLACQRGYQNVMLLLLHFGASIMALDNEGNTPLHLSCANGHEDCVKALVFYDANMKNLQINAANEFGDTPLHFAAKWGYESIVKTLLENGADATLCNRKKQSPVSVAQNVKVQRWLQVVADGLTFQPIQPQVTGAKGGTVSKLPTSSSGNQLSSSLNIYEPEPSSSFHVETASLEAATEVERKRRKEKLFKAIIEGDIQLVKFYLGQDVDDMSGIEEDDEMMDVEVADQKATVGDMCHPLCQCSKCRGIHKVTQRSGEKVNVDIKTSTGYCPIHMAVIHNHSDIVELLINLHADVNVQNHKGLTPIHLACCMKNSLVTDMLLRAKARLDYQDMNGDTPILIAASNGFINGLQMLRKAGAKLNITNSKGNTALHEALKRQHFDVVRTLIDGGADPRIHNKHDIMPVQLTEDASMQALLMSTAFKLTEQEAKAENNNTSNSYKENGSCYITIKELFSAFEEDDLHTLNALNASIRSFDHKHSLKHTITKDRSVSQLQRMAQDYSITSFDKGTLRKVKSLDKTRPFHIFSPSKSLVEDGGDGCANIVDSCEDQLTVKGDHSMSSCVFQASLARDPTGVNELSEREAFGKVITEPVLSDQTMNHCTPESNTLCEEQAEHRLTDARDSEEISSSSLSTGSVD